MSLTAIDTAIGALILAAFIAVLAWAGEQDYQEALREERTACLMVAQGHWPAETAEGYRCPERVAGAME